MKILKQESLVTLINKIQEDENINIAFTKGNNTLEIERNNNPILNFEVYSTIDNDLTDTHLENELMNNLNFFIEDEEIPSNKVYQTIKHLLDSKDNSTTV